MSSNINARFADMKYVLDFFSGFQCNYMKYKNFFICCWRMAATTKNYIAQVAEVISGLVSKISWFRKMKRTLRSDFLLDIRK